MLKQETLWLNFFQWIIDKVEFHMSDALLSEIKASAAVASAKKADKKEINMEHFIENTQLRQQVDDLISANQSLQKKLNAKEEKDLKKQRLI